MFASKAERDLIVEMLAAGRITVAQARGLFDAIERHAAQESELEPFAAWEDLSTGLNKTMQDAVRQAGHAVQAAEWAY